MADEPRRPAPPLASLIGAYRDPHRAYDAARADSGIGYDAASKSWIVTGHAIAKAILSDERFNSGLYTGPGAKPPGKMPFLQAVVQKQILFSDDDRHRRVQKVVLQESARTMHDDAARIRALAERLIQAALARGRIDLVADFALPYTMDTICRMVGIPVDDDAMLAELAQWSGTFANLTSGYLQVHMREIGLLGDRIRALVARPAEELEGVVKAFAASGEFEDEDDLVANTMMVFAAGRITTQKVLGDGLPLLMRDWPAWRAAFADDTAIVRHVAEELLRVVTPTRYVVRRAAADADLTALGAPGSTVRSGERVFLFLEAANRDPTPFPEAHQLLASRQPNAQIAFGHGPHRCPGASLARLEIQVALDAFLRMVTDLRPDPAATPSWEPNPNLGGFKSYPCFCR